MKTTVTITALATLAGLFPALPASAQDSLRLPPYPPAPGMIPTGDGGWRQPTVKDALELLAREKKEVLSPEDFYDPSVWQGSPYDPAVAILRQAFGPRPEAELAGLADRLGEMMADTTLSRDIRYNASAALRISASDAYNDEGTPYPRAFDVLVRVYESGSDGALTTIFLADRKHRGLAYVRNLFERSERPALCFREWGITGARPNCVGDPGRTPWCRAGGILYREIVREAKRRTWPGGVIVETAGEPQPMPDGLPEHVEDWHRRCL